MVKLGSNGLGNEFVHAQDSVSEVFGLEVMEGGKGESGSRWGSVKRDFQDQVVGGRLR